MFQINNKEEHKDIISSLEKFHDTTNLKLKDMTDKLDKALEKKADKTVVDNLIKGIWWFVAVIGAGIIGYVGSLLIKVIEMK